MLFNLEADTGDRVIGYVVPDGFSGIPAISVCSRGRELLKFHANEVRQSLVAAGRHESGTCGFTLDTAILPDLPALQELELFDVETGLLIYRRPGKDIIKKKLLRLETHFFPLWRFDSALHGRFQYFAKGVEQLGRETVTQLFLLNQVESAFISGRILYKNYAYFIESGFQTVAILHDPYEELAERLLVLSKLRQLGSEHLGMRDSMSLQAAINFAQNLPFAEEKALNRAIRNMPADVAAAFTNPVTRQLTTATPDEMPSGGAVALALDLLASFAIVGLRREPGKFISGLAELLDMDERSLPDIPHLTAVAPLAKQLKNLPELEILLEKDLELYHYVDEAFKK
ncbi:hypothetical protein [Methyloferula stellata]|uniref:hypothetical protein n=1 Tax=Methyloferula stellata TaxID=876270 RepID=UPI0003647D88|nr:hypothetical protein [Methyloferula stellata]